MFFNLAYAIALILLSPVILYRRVRHGRYRRGARQKLFGLSADEGAMLRGDGGGVIWLHGVSVGEVNLLPPLAATLRRRHPAWTVVVSASTDAGYDLARRHFGDNHVFFCPLDFTWATRRTLRHLRCAAVVLAELELWPNLIAAANAAGCPVIVVNGRLGRRSAAGYQRLGGWLGPTFARLTAIGCQDTEAASRFVACGSANGRVVVTGSMKFDGAPSSRETSEVLDRMNWAGVDPWHRVWCVGSTIEGEEAMALRVYRRLAVDHPDLRLLLVPRHPERFGRVAGLVVAKGYRLIRRSLDESQYHDQWEGDEVMLIDTIGELKHWWGVAHLATVGGSFGNRGGQSMIEPAGYGCAVSFGPDTRNFRVIADAVLAAGGAVRVKNEAELESLCVGV